MLKRTITILLSWKTFIFLFALLATLILPLKPRFTPQHVFKDGFSYWLWIWGNFDGDHYMQIARTGYNIAELPFFPLFPLTIRSLHFIGIPYLIGGLIIAHVGFISSIYLIHQTLELDKKSHLFILVLLAMVTFPTSYSYGAVYNDSTFFIFACLTIYFGRKKQWGLASISGFFATLSRLNGLALFFYIIIEYLIDAVKKPEDTFNLKVLIKELQKKLHIVEILKSFIWTVALVPLSYLSYLIWIQINYGNWNKIYSAMEAWRQNIPTLPIQVFWRYAKILLFYRPLDLIYMVAAIEIGMVIFYIFMMIYSWKKIRLSYWIFFIVSILIPATTGTFAGMPRYGLHLYPLFLSIALLLEDQKTGIKVAYYVISLTLLFICLTLFTRGYFIA